MGEWGFDDYQDEAMGFRKTEADEMYAVLQVGAEAGELLTHYAKRRRGDALYDEEFFKRQVKKELGDILWSLAAIARDHGWYLSDVAYTNIDKLVSRQERGTLKGSGDDR